MKFKTLNQAQYSIIIIVILFLLLTAISLYVNLDKTSKEHKELAAVTGRTFFQSIVAARAWNASHNGVYVPITKELQPNPYLEDTMKNITTTDGMKLTKINPAYMTRLISEILKQKKNVQFRMTSLDPINPENKADTWEIAALKRVEKGISEEYEIT